MDDLVELGYISKAFGLKGAVVITLFNEESVALQIGVSLIIKHGKISEKLKITEVMGGNRIFFEGIVDRTQAESLTGAKVLILASDLPETSPDEIYLNSMLGLAVFDIQNKLVGKISGFSSNTAQILLEVKTTLGHTAIIPLVEPIVIKIDLENKKVIIDPPAGLLDPMD